MKQSADTGLFHERRSGIDRRKKTPLIFNKYWWRGQRAVPRRREDREKAYRVDLHGPKTLTAILVIVLLSITDALFTLHLIRHGATEINPVMAYFLKRGPLVFFLAKYLLTVLSIFMILPRKNFFLFKTKVRVKALLLLFALPFLLVVKWEVYLLLFVL